MNDKEYISLVQALNMKGEHLEQAFDEVRKLESLLLKARDRHADLVSEYNYIEEKLDEMRWEADEVAYEKEAFK